MVDQYSMANILNIHLSGRFSYNCLHKFGSDLCFLKQPLLYIILYLIMSNDWDNSIYKYE